MAIEAQSRQGQKGKEAYQENPVIAMPQSIASSMENGAPADIGIVTSEVAEPSWTRKLDGVHKGTRWFGRHVTPKIRNVPGAIHKTADSVRSIFQAVRQIPERTSGQSEGEPIVINEIATPSAIREQPNPLSNPIVDFSVTNNGRQQEEVVIPQSSAQDAKSEPVAAPQQKKAVITAEVTTSRDEGRHFDTKTHLLGDLEDRLGAEKKSEILALRNRLVSAFEARAYNTDHDTGNAAKLHEAVVDASKAIDRHFLVTRSKPNPEMTIDELNFLIGLYREQYEKTSDALHSEIWQERPNRFYFNQVKEIQEKSEDYIFQAVAYREAIRGGKDFPTDANPKISIILSEDSDANNAPSRTRRRTSKKTTNEPNPIKDGEDEITIDAVEAKIVTNGGNSTSEMPLAEEIAKVVAAGAAAQESIREETAKKAEQIIIGQEAVNTAADAEEIIEVPIVNDSHTADANISKEPIVVDIPPPKGRSRRRRQETTYKAPEPEETVASSTQTSSTTVVSVVRPRNWKGIGAAALLGATFGGVAGGVIHETQHVHYQPTISGYSEPATQILTRAYDHGNWFDLPPGGTNPINVDGTGRAYGLKIDHCNDSISDSTIEQHVPGLDTADKYREYGYNDPFVTAMLLDMNRDAFIGYNITTSSEIDQLISKLAANDVSVLDRAKALTDHVEQARPDAGFDQTIMTLDGPGFNEAEQWYIAKVKQEAAAGNLDTAKIWSTLHASLVRAKQALAAGDDVNYWIEDDEVITSPPTSQSTSYVRQETHGIGKDILTGALLGGALGGGTVAAFDARRRRPVVASTTRTTTTATVSP
jgi:hypothetical protein